MPSNVKGFAESAKGFTKSPLGIIALFIVLVYGFATLATTFGSNLSEHIVPLIYFLVIFPVIVFIGFLWLVSKHHDKIYGPSDFKDEGNFLKMKMMSVASLAAASAKQNNNYELTEQELDSIVETVSKTTKENKNASPEKWSKRILWVDDRPENNVYERKAFESLGVIVSTALSTNEALEMIAKNNYSAIISDMGRNEGPREGYVLLEKIRKSGNRTPFFIYAGSNLPEHKKMAIEKGAQGSTNRAQELFEMVINDMSLN
jgi:CheY-like chemotaxis protein